MKKTSTYIHWFTESGGWCDVVIKHIWNGLLRADRTGNQVGSDGNSTHYQ